MSAHIAEENWLE